MEMVRAIPQTAKFPSEPLKKDNYSLVLLCQLLIACCLLNIISFEAILHLHYAFTIYLLLFIFPQACKVLGPHRAYILNCQQILLKSITDDRYSLRSLKQKLDTTVPSS